MKWFLLAGLLSVSAFADTRSVSNTFSFDAEEGSFTEIFSHGQTLKITYTVTALPAPVMTDADLTIAQDMKCISWTYPGTSPDDPGECGQYAWTGKYRISNAYKEIPLFSVKETVTDVKTGKKRVRDLKNISGTFYIANGEVLTDKPEVPANLNFVGYVQGDFYWNCANETVKTGPVLENLPVYVSVCTEAKGSATLQKVNGEYKFTVNPEIKFRSSMSAFWMVRDFPRTDYVRKGLWFRDPSLEYVMK